MEDFRTRGLGLIPKELDPRDFTYSATYGAVVLPDEYQLDISGIKVHDQGKYQNCGTHALAACVETVLSKVNKYSKVSFPWYYGNRRYSEHKGQGTEARGLLKGAQKDGGLYLSDYPYEEEVPEVINRFNSNYEKFKSKAQNIRIKNYYQCITAEDAKKAVYNGYPVLVGTIVFKSFYEISKDNLIMPEPRIKDHSLEPMAGGHMMLIIGWNKKGFIVLNSWGEAFGDNGTFIMPYSIVDWSQRNGFPIPLFEAWAIDGIYIDGKLLDVGKPKDAPTVEEGWYKSSGKWRYREDGKDIVGWKKINNIWYYFKSDGYMATGWVKDEGKWYYLDTNGAMRTNWTKLNNRWYYFKADGSACTGYNIIDGKMYYFAESWYEDIQECQLIMTDDNGAIIL